MSQIKKCKMYFGIVTPTLPTIFYSCEDSSRECDNDHSDSSNWELQSVLIESGQDMVPDLRKHYPKQQWHICHCQKYKRKREKV